LKPKIIHKSSAVGHSILSKYQAFCGRIEV
jgi:hypothetical protein